MQSKKKISIAFLLMRKVKCFKTSSKPQTLLCIFTVLLFQFSGLDHDVMQVELSGVSRCPDMLAFGFTQRRNSQRRSLPNALLCTKLVVCIYRCFFCLLQTTSASHTDGLGRCHVNRPERRPKPETILLSYFFSVPAWIGSHAEDGLSPEKKKRTRTHISIFVGIFIYMLYYPAPYLNPNRPS